MDNIYYTPKIEEFCIGFEYEQALVDTYWNISEWKKTIFLQNTDFNNLIKYINFNRVKYLDKEDIESLGFTFNSKNLSVVLEEPIMVFRNETSNTALAYYYNSHRVSLITADLSKDPTYNLTGQDPNKIAPLKIKNKTELVKLLNQLNIKQ